MNSDWNLERDAFLAMTPPRYVPAAVRKRAAPLRGILALTLFGLVFGGFGSFFAGVFFPTHLPKQWELDRGPSTVVAGTIEDVSETNLSVNDVKVMRYRFRYRPDGGEELKGVAFTTGSRWKPDDSVEVRHLIADPALAAPLGARLGQGDAMLLFVLLFPLVGFGLVIGAIAGLRRKRRLLRHGWVGRATVDALERTNAKVNDHQQYKIRLTLTDLGRTIAKRVHDPKVVGLLEERHRSGDPVTVLHDANKPRRLDFPESWT